MNRFEHFETKETIDPYDEDITLWTAGFEKIKYVSLEEAERKIGRERLWQNITVWGGSILIWGSFILGTDQVVTHVLPHLTFLDNPVIAIGLVAAVVSGYHLVEDAKHSEGFIKSREQWLKNYKKIN